MLRLAIASFVIALAAAVPASAQALKIDFAYGRDYTFERMEATRAVDDAEDTGTIRLVTYVYRPVKNDRREVVLFSHGGAGGLARSPKEALDAPPRPLIRFFVSRGYTLVAPLRRGRGESTGTYVEECSLYVGQCDQMALTERGVREALLDTNAVIDQLILGRLVPRESKIVVAGHSRGGFLSLILAAERPTLANAVINFAGGWLATTDNLSAVENQQRTEAQAIRLARAAKDARVPTIWIYAVRDPLYKDTFPPELLRSWREAGGQAEFVHITEHSMPNAHQVPSDATLWGRQMDVFMKLIESPR
jgi:dienelactone hydrolase